MVPYMKANGSQISNMVMESKHGKMEQNSKVAMLKERNMAMELLLGLTDQHIKVNLITIIFTVMVNINGLMEECTWVHGRTTRWRAAARPASSPATGKTYMPFFLKFRSNFGWLF